MAANPNSILDSTKQALGLDPEYPVFDAEIIMHINSVFSTLTQLGVGPSAGFEIVDATKLWTEFLGTDARLNTVKPYVYKKVRLVFDPPRTSYAITAFEKMIAEDEFRILVAAESDKLAEKFPEESTDPDPDEFPIYFTETI